MSKTIKYFSAKDFTRERPSFGISPTSLSILGREELRGSLLSIFSSQGYSKVIQKGEMSGARNTILDSLISYEKSIAKVVHADHAIAFGYARHGLVNILDAAGLKSGDEVILSPLTCKVVPLALFSKNLKPIYADISKHSLNLSQESVFKKIGFKTRAIIFQHTYGNTKGIEEIKTIAEEKKLLLVEDCAQCLPFSIDGQTPGTWGQASIFSNNLRKPLPAGSGGVVVTDNQEFAGKIRKRRDDLQRRGKAAELLLRAEIFVHKNFLRPIFYWPLYELNRMVSAVHSSKSLESEIKTIIFDTAFQTSDYQIQQGHLWLENLEALIEQRRKVSAEYFSMLKGGANLIIPNVELKAPLFYFPLLVNEKQKLLERARKKCIEIISWPLKMPIYPIETEEKLVECGYYPGSCPAAEYVAQHLIGLPTDFATGKRERSRVVHLIKSHCEKYS